MNHEDTTGTIRLDALSEEQLAQRVRRGCVRSYEELDRRLRPRLVYLLFKRTGSHEDAEDLAQETLLRAYRKIDQHDPNKRFSPWLFTIAIRGAIDLHRKRRRGGRVTGEGVEHAADPRPCPAETADQRDGQRHLWALADRVLSPVPRTALWLHYGEQQTTRQIAKVLGINVAHVRVVLYRARRTLLKHLEPAREPRPAVAKPVRIQHSRPAMKEGALS
jgi:RNA polymerase sigma-70 factor, ECF subfamily